ncbi:energy transducer TonB [Zooshikella sp. RANM57]|uniref:energy transducer TonB n=1 Tax=Zooshikella sp. RANM57 TaxID=3425863 RepID=UPI003D6EE660
MKKYYLLLVLLSAVLTGCTSFQNKVVEPKSEQRLDINSISFLISKRITENWNKPQSSSQSLQVKIQVKTKKDGSLVNAKVVESSGNEMFDRSALEALSRVFPLEELTKLKSEEYEKNFKKFKLFFKSV